VLRLFLAPLPVEVDVIRVIYAKVTRNARTPSPSTRARRIGMRGVERVRGVGKWRRGLRVSRACGRVPPLSQGQPNAFSAQKHLSEPLMIIEPEISL
jgi:hypothetical protein